MRDVIELSMAYTGRKEAVWSEGCRLKELLHSASKLVPTRDGIFGGVITRRYHNVVAG